MSKAVSKVLHPIDQAVRKLYDRFPYPHYPLLAKLRWQEGYTSSSKFAARLLEQTTGCEAAINASRGQFVRNSRTVLVAGAGDTQPYIMRKNEPAAHRMMCVDLSAANLKRARFRLKATMRSTAFIHSEINQFLKQQASVTGPYDHIDVYGVLHHLQNPSETLKLLSSHLSSNGTMRIMVYNAPARNWIHQFQLIFKLLKLDPFLKADRKIARMILQRCAIESPYLHNKMRSMKSIISNDSRLVDTFFHAREAKISISRWFEILDNAGLKVFSLYDRYGELDDIENPLWHPPTASELEQRSKKGSFCNNLELYVCKKNIKPKSASSYGYEFKPKKVQLLPFYFKLPPIKWFRYPETRDIPWFSQIKIWHKFINEIYLRSNETIDSYKNRFSTNTLKRLCRLGVIFPGQFKNESLKQSMKEPLISETINIERNIDQVDFTLSPFMSEIDSLLKSRNLTDHRLRKLILLRLNKSQL